MRLTSRPVLAFLIGLALIIAGFIFLLRGCLSRYDERFARTPLLLVENKGQQRLVSLVEYQRAVNYSRSGGMTRKTIRVTYYLQAHDVQTGAVTGSVKIKKGKAIKQYPVELIAASGPYAWLFAGELMAFDAFTLEKKADIAELEKENPGLKGLFPAERRYYAYRPGDRDILFTSTDGRIWKLDLVSLKATESTEDPGLTPAEQAVERLNKAVQANRDAQDSLYQQKSYRPARAYQAGQLDAATYRSLQAAYMKEREMLSKQRDSLYTALRQAEKQTRESSDLERKKEQLQRGNAGFDQLRVNQDTLAGQWWGLYTAAELQKAGGRFDWQSAYGETARRQLYTAPLSENREGEPEIRPENARPAALRSSYLQGGFLLDKNTALPVRLAGGERLIIHRDKLGREGSIQVSRVSGNAGTDRWTVNSGLAEWGDWLLTSQSLIILGSRHPELSSGENNRLLVIELNSGKTSVYDYFNDKLER